jgi:riboflavin kinase/FMN adenylyltransferase
MNIGVRPTLQNATPEKRVEVHLLDFDGELYGKELEVIFTEKLRDEKKFGSLTELKEQIAQDISKARSDSSGAS